MAETRTIARPYAEAVFRLAKAKGDLSNWSNMLQFSATIAMDERVRSLVGNPKMSATRLGEMFLD
ncbi:MAG TPA: F0F1 ATP synthase subunit delta, partial [Nitrosospira sp.]|nr:F0F1 ATP synthase subunit delta [Nitrosospira sp.]